MVELILLAIHIAAGSIALLTAAMALVTPKGERWHIRAGRVYAIAMALVFVTAVPLAILGSSIFLFLIAFFSFYLVFAGWRFARNRQRRAHPVDWAAVGILAVTGLGMWGYAIVIGLNGSSQWVTLLVFGGIALSAERSGRAVSPDATGRGATGGSALDQYDGRDHRHDHGGYSSERGHGAGLGSLDLAHRRDYAADCLVEHSHLAAGAAAVNV